MVAAVELGPLQNGGGVGIRRRELAHPGGKADVLPNQIITVAPASDFNVHSLRPKHVDAVLKRSDNVDLGDLVEFGDIMHAIFERAITTHIVDHAPAGHDDAITGLLNTRHMTKPGMVGYQLAGDTHLIRLPEPIDVRRTDGARLATTNKERWWKQGPPTNRRIGDRY